MWPARRSPVMLMVILALSLLVALVAASAPLCAKPARIAFLGLTPAPPASALPPVVAAFQQHLRELGWVEGQNLTIEWRWAEGSLDRFATLVEEMVRLPVEVLVVPNQTTALVAQRATTTIPIVMVGGGAIAQTVPSLARPGGNVTGVAALGPELATKRLELLTQAIPGLTRVAVLRGLSPQPLELQALWGCSGSSWRREIPPRSTRRLPRRSARGLAPWWCLGTGVSSFPIALNSRSWPSHTGCRRSSTTVRLSRRVGS